MEVDDRATPTYCPVNDGGHGAEIIDSNDEGTWRECSDCGHAEWIHRSMRTGGR